MGNGTLTPQAFVALVLLLSGCTGQKTFQDMAEEIRLPLDESLDKASQLVEEAYIQLRLEDDQDGGFPQVKDYPEIETLLAEASALLDKVRNVSDEYVDRYYDAMVNVTLEITELEWQEVTMNQTILVHKQSSSSNANVIDGLRKSLQDAQWRLSNAERDRSESIRKLSELRDGKPLATFVTVISFGIASNLRDLSKDIGNLEHRIEQLRGQIAALRSEVERTETALNKAKRSQQEASSQVEQVQQQVVVRQQRQTTRKVQQKQTAQLGEEVKKANTFLIGLHAKVSVLHETNKGYVLIDLLNRSLRRLFAFLVKEMRHVEALASPETAEDVALMHNIINDDSEPSQHPRRVRQVFSGQWNAQNGSVQERMERSDHLLTNVSSVYREFRLNFGDEHWERILSSVSTATAILGHLISQASSDADWSLSAQPRGDNLVHIRRPQSFRITLLQLSNVLYTTLLKLEICMSELQMRAISVPLAMKRLVDSLDSDHNDADKQFTGLLDQFLDAANMAPERSVQVEKAFGALLDLTNEIIDAVRKRQNQLPNVNKRIASQLSRLVPMWSDLSHLSRGVFQVVAGSAALEYATFAHQMERGRLTKALRIKSLSRKMDLHKRLMDQVVRTDRAAYVLYELASSFLAVSSRYLTPQVIELDQLMSFGAESTHSASERRKVADGIAGHILNELVESKERIVDNVVQREQWIGKGTCKPKQLARPCAECFPLPDCFGVSL